MTLLEKRADLMRQIRTLEKEVAIIDEQLKANYSVEYIANGGMYWMSTTSNAFLCVYYNRTDKTYYTKSILLNAKGRRLGYNTAKKDVLAKLEKLKADGYVEVQ